MRFRKLKRISDIHIVDVCFLTQYVCASFDPSDFIFTLKDTSLIIILAEILFDSQISRCLLLQFNSSSRQFSFVNPFSIAASLNAGTTLGSSKISSLRFRLFFGMRFSVVSLLACMENFYRWRTSVLLFSSQKVAKQFSK